MNKNLKNLNKIEFVVTNACTGCCKHCSQGDHPSFADRIDPEMAANAVLKIASKYSIETVMAFGGEPLLHPDAVYAIMNAAKKMNIPKRQVITNGFFSQDSYHSQSIAAHLAKCGVNDLLVSVDAFHQETIPIDIVKEFVRHAQKNRIPVRLQPAWLVSPENENPYNQKTRELLASFEKTEIPVGEGNVVFPEGNAIHYLSHYFENGSFINPYIEDPKDVRCVSFSPNGDVLNGNVYTCDVLEILKSYTV